MELWGHLLAGESAKLCLHVTFQDYTALVSHLMDTLGIRRLFCETYISIGAHVLRLLSRLALCIVGRADHPISGRIGKDEQCDMEGYLA